MKQVAIIGGLAVVLAMGVSVVLDRAGLHTGATLADTHSFSCLDTTGTITTDGAVPDVSCITTGGTSHLSITTKATPAPAPKPKSTTSATVKNSGGGQSHTSVTINGQTTASDTGDVHIEQHSTQTSNGGKATNHNSTTINITTD